LIYIDDPVFGVNLEQLARFGADTEHGADASMREIARRAGVGLATLLRHFPTREALFEALVRPNLDALTQKAVELDVVKDRSFATTDQIPIGHTHTMANMTKAVANEISRTEERSLGDTKWFALRHAFLSPVGRLTRSLKTG
jgi:AcrR family transcriptional regulator